MEYTKFTLGLRFAMTSDANLTPEGCWNIAFSEVPLTHTAGSTLFGAWDDIGAYESESAYICMFSNLPLKTGKALYQQLLRKPALLSYLTIYRPFIQNNLVEKCASPEYLGEVQEDGTVACGEKTFGAMRISGEPPAACDKKLPCTRILIAPDAWAGKFTSADATRHMLRAAARILPKAVFSTQLIADGGEGTMDALVCSVNGRYGGAKLKTEDGTAIELRYGILPDRTVVLESETLSQEMLSQALSLPQTKGYQRYIIAAGTGVLPDSVPPGVDATVLGKRIPASKRNSAQIEYRNGVETLLEICEFHEHLSAADWLIALTRLLDQEGSMNDPTTDALLFHCRTQGKHSAVLAFTDDNRYYAKIDGSPLVPIKTDSFDEAADALFLIIRNTPVSPAPVLRAQDETVISDT